MTVFELVRFGCGGEKPCRFGCENRKSCSRLASGELEDAIRLARELIDEDPMNVIEVRCNGQFQCTVGHGWMSRRAAAQRPEGRLRRIFGSHRHRHPSQPA